MSGVKIGDMKEIGSTTRCTGSAKFNGQTVESMKVSTKMIKSTDRVHSIGLTEGNMWEGG